MRNRFIAVVVAALLAGTSVMAQQTGQISGTAKDTAKAPYPEYSVRVRNVRSAGMIVATTTLDNTGAFRLPDLAIASYLVELVRKDGKVVCTEASHFELEARVGIEPTTRFLSGRPASRRSGR